VGGQLAWEGKGSLLRRAFDEVLQAAGFVRLAKDRKTGGGNLGRGDGAGKGGKGGVGCSPAEQKKDRAAMWAKPRNGSSCSF